VPHSPLVSRTGLKRQVILIFTTFPLKWRTRQIDVLSWMTRTALELVGQSGLGYSFDNLTEDEIPHRYTQSAKQLMYDTQRYFVGPLCWQGTIDPNPTNGCSPELICCRPSSKSDHLDSGGLWLMCYLGSHFTSFEICLMFFTRHQWRFWSRKRRLWRQVMKL